MFVLTRAVEGLRELRPVEGGGANVAPHKITAPVEARKTKFGGYVEAVGNSVLCEFHDPRLIS